MEARASVRYPSHRPPRPGVARQKGRGTDPLTGLPLHACYRLTIPGKRGSSGNLRGLRRMAASLALTMLTALFPLARAWAGNRATTLRPALAWAAAAAVAWAAADLYPDSEALAYLALCSSGCAGIAVLGARRPGVGAWNFVVGGLLAVLLLPVASGPGTRRLETAHVLFLGATLAVTLLNHLPTRLGVAVPLAGIAFGLDLARLAGAVIPAALLLAGRVLLVLAPWAAWLALRKAAPASEVDRLWLGFRNRYGFLWAQRVREQFNRSAASAGLRARLGWSGVRPAEAAGGEELSTLRALLKRFGPSPDTA